MLFTRCKAHVYKILIVPAHTRPPSTPPATKVSSPLKALGSTWFALAVGLVDFVLLLIRQVVSRVLGCCMMNQIVLGDHEPPFGSHLSPTHEDGIPYVLNIWLLFGGSDPDVTRAWAIDVLSKSPIYIAGLSIVVLFIQVNYAAFASSKPPAGGFVSGRSRFSQHVASLGGASVFTFNALRLLACLALVGLTLPTTVLGKAEEWHLKLQRLDVLHDGLCAIFVRRLGVL